MQKEAWESFVQKSVTVRKAGSKNEPGETEPEPDLFKSEDEAAPAALSPALGLTFGGLFAAVWIATIASKVTFYSIFQVLQHKLTFAPLRFQNFQVFAHFGDFCRFFQNFAENRLKS